MESSLRLRQLTPIEIHPPHGRGASMLLKLLSFLRHWALLMVDIHPFTPINLSSDHLQAVLLSIQIHRTDCPDDTASWDVQCMSCCKLRYWKLLFLLSIDLFFWGEVNRHRIFDLWLHARGWLSLDSLLKINLFTQMQLSISVALVEPWLRAVQERSSREIKPSPALSYQVEVSLLRCASPYMDLLCISWLALY